ncbi:CUB domain-containing protein 2 isoform X1 [Stegostoma tigrinum]|uniref:CUB domain-containing protein 2 isoform X1 n=1 Tax=Stegostoma tigrinum TaxID=3053191 RepID=UPI00202B9122|nr:CUB domain-containing protein 2 isoform X1 [Stegostoma tigrinum]
MSVVNHFCFYFRCPSFTVLFCFSCRKDGSLGWGDWNQGHNLKRVKCGGILSATNGNFSSPNFPGYYPYDTKCTWLIVVTEGSSILLTFHYFDLEFHTYCEYDYIKIYNGVPEDEGNLLGTFCGKIFPPHFTSSWHVMSIIFHSDKHVVSHGFSASYRKDMCGGVVTGLSGVLSSPEYPDNYPNNAECRWIIRVSNQSVVNLVFYDFHLENNEDCSFDYVALFDGSSMKDRHWGHYCGGTKPPNMISSGSELLVVFKSDFNIGARGFKAFYFSGECQQVFTAIKGNFSSPRYPNIYPNNINCHWTIQQPLGYRINVHLNDFELEDRDSLTDACDYDFLAIFDGESETDTLIGKWCGQNSPSSLLSNGNRLLFVLSADRNTASRGFHVSYDGVIPMNISCTRTDFQIQIAAHAVPSLSRSNIYLGNQDCTAQVFGSVYKIISRFDACGTKTQRRRNVTIFVNILYVMFSDGTWEDNQEYEVQCDLKRKAASYNVITDTEQYQLQQQAVNLEDSNSDELKVEDGSDLSRTQDSSDIVFIGICVLAGILMLIAIIGLVLL